ncbi:hypothetical protein [Streptomyces sp. YGL11-2]|uniref:hypothetical protein n=1 Tax=Streptomyces sp. YGL11-2 TaxID=3414028 RepID=UPI003CF45FDF
MTSQTALRRRTAPADRAGRFVGAPGLGECGAGTVPHVACDPAGQMAPGAGADTASVALALVGTVHHLLMTGWAGAPDPRERAERLVALLVGPAGDPRGESGGRTARRSDQADRRPAPAASAYSPGSTPAHCAGLTPPGPAAV